MNIKILRYCLAAFFLLVVVVSGSVLAGEGPEHRTPHGKNNPWQPDSGKVVYDGDCPPPHACSKLQPYAPHSYGYPAYYHHYCQPETPWYEKQLPDSAGRLAVMVDPVQAKVYLDGYPLKRQEDLAYEAGLLTGGYTVEVRAEGYETHRQDVRIEGGQRLQLAIRLERLKSDGR